MQPSWHPVPAGTPRRRCRRAVFSCSSDGAAVILKSGPEIKNRCMQEGLNREFLTSILKSGLEIKNRCTKEGVIGEKLASIPKFGPEIKNRCMKQHIPRHAFHRAQKHASCLGCFAWGGLEQVRQWRRKRVLMRPEAAFPYVFAAEGAQHPPNKPPRSTSRHAQRPTTLNVPPPLRQSQKRMTSADVILFDL